MSFVSLLPVWSLHTMRPCYSPLHTPPSCGFHSTQDPPLPSHATTTQTHSSRSALRTTTHTQPLNQTGDINAIVVGDKTNIQDNVIVHVAKHSAAVSAGTGAPKPTIIGQAVTVGHGATLHACTIGDGCLVRRRGRSTYGCVCVRERGGHVLGAFMMLLVEKSHKANACRQAGMNSELLVCLGNQPPV